MGNVSDIQWNLSSLWCWWGIMVERLERVWGMGNGGEAVICQ